MLTLPQNFVAMKHLFVIIALLGACFSASAFAEVDTLCEEDPYVILMGEADSAIVRQDWPEAAARLRDALAVKPNHPSNVLLLNNLAAVYSNMDMDSLSLATYDQALEIAPAMLTVVTGRARQLLKMRRDYEAFDAFSNAIAIDSTCIEARFYHGMMALYGGNQAVAEQDFAVLQRMVPGSIDTAIALSSLYALTGRDREAVPYLRFLTENDPQAEYYAQLAGCYLQLGDLNEASDIIGRGLERFPDDPELYYYRAWLNRDRYLMDAARADAARALQLGASPQRVAALFAN